MTAPERGALLLPGKLDGIDLSYVQTGVDYAKLAASGFKFAVVKASEGVTGRDPRCAQHLAGCRSEGMYAWTYGFGRPSLGDPAGQARNLYEASGETYTRMCLDLEVRGDLSNGEIIAWAEEFCAELETFGALAPVVYTYPDFARRLQPDLGKSIVLARTDLWMAWIPRAEPYAPGPLDVPYSPLPWARASCWQYGGDGTWRTPGIPMTADRNLFMGDDAALRAWLGLPPEAA